MLELRPIKRRGLAGATFSNIRNKAAASAVNVMEKSIVNWIGEGEL